MISPTKEMKNIAVGYAFLVFLIFVRTTLAGSYSLVFLLWNVFLALLVYVLSLVFVAKKKNTILSTSLFFLWIIFFANAPYVMTDLIHMRSLARVTPFLDAAIIFYAAWLSMFLAILSFGYVYAYIQKYFSRTISYLFLANLFFLTTFAIYLGRFKRFNSWDIFVHPHHIVYELFSALTVSMYSKQEMISSVAVASVCAMCVYVWKGAGKE